MRGEKKTMFRRLLLVIAIVRVAGMTTNTPESCKTLLEQKIREGCPNAKMLLPMCESVVVESQMRKVWSLAQHL